jgi:hypothetical protein
LWSTIGTDPEAKFTADTFTLINQGDTGFDIFINGGPGTSRDTWRVKAMHAGKGKIILINLLTSHLRPNPMYPDQLRAFWIANRGFCGMRCQVML